MSLLGLAIIGRRNEPLYLCDCVRVLQEAKQRHQQARNDSMRSSISTTTTEDGAAAEATAATEAEVEAETSTETPSAATTPTPQEQEKENDDNADKDADDDPFGFREDAKTCDLGRSLPMDHVLKLHSALDQLEELIETTAAGLPVPKRRTGHWLGLLTEQEEAVYGYITATNIKFLVLVQPPVKESDIRLFLNGIHDSFITYSMNPFSKLRGRIQSKRFDQSIQEAVRDYEDNRVYVL